MVKKKKEKQPEIMREDAAAIIAPGSGTKETFGVALGTEIFAIQEFCNYKAMLVMEIIGEFSEEIDLASIITGLRATHMGEDAAFVWSAVAVKVLPQALQKVPREATRLAALCLIPNKKLAELYDQPNGIAEEIARIGKLIDFQGAPGLSLEIIAEALPYIGLDALKNALTGLGGVLGKILPSEEQTPSTG